jgi:hypothetical protein
MPRMPMPYSPNAVYSNMRLERKGKARRGGRGKGERRGGEMGRGKDVNGRGIRKVNREKIKSGRGR